MSRIDRDATDKRQIRMVCPTCGIAETRWTHLARECKRCGRLMRHRTVSQAQRERRANEPDTFWQPRKRLTRDDVRARIAARFAVRS